MDARGPFSFRGNERMSPSDDDAILATVTHARLRAAQGDVPGALRVLETILARRPQDAPARELAGRLGRDGRSASPAARSRLLSWRERILKNRGAR